MTAQGSAFAFHPQCLSSKTDRNFKGSVLTTYQKIKASEQRNLVKIKSLEETKIDNDNHYKNYVLEESAVYWLWGEKKYFTHSMYPGDLNPAVRHIQSNIIFVENFPHFRVKYDTIKRKIYVPTDTANSAPENSSPLPALNAMLTQQTPGSGLHDTSNFSTHGIINNQLATLSFFAAMTLTSIPDIATKQMFFRECLNPLFIQITGNIQVSTLNSPIDTSPSSSNFSKFFTQVDLPINNQSTHTSDYPSILITKENSPHTEKWNENLKL